MSCRASLALALLVACASSDDPKGEPTPPGTTPTGSTPTVPQPTMPTGSTLPTTERPDPDPIEPCDVPLQATLSQPGVLSYQSLRVEASGGVGPYVFSMADAPSGGFVNANSGDYFAGDTDGVTDVVQVDDTTCGTTTTAPIEVFLPLQVLPTTGLIPVATTFTLSVEQGSGTYRCDPRILESAGSLTGCDYTAGPQTGSDTLVVVDELTGEEVEVAYEVVVDGGIEPWGATWMLPLGHPATLRMVGGSGVVDAVPADGSVASFDGVHLTGLAEGHTTVALTDRFTGETSTLEAVVAAPRTAPLARDGENTDWAHVRGADVNGDGYADAVVALVDAAVASHLGGGVFVYLGGPTGLDPEPSQVFGIEQPGSYGARSLAVGDLNGDGLVDLAYGAAQYDLLPDVDIGTVRIHEGVPGGGFDPDPTWTRNGTYGSDQFGYGLTACDVDGDGIDDLLVAALRGEDRDADPIVYDTGSIAVFTGNPGGPSVQPVATAYGWIPDGNGWGQRNHNLGHELVSGDVDGDGRCDVAVSSYGESLVDNADNGLVWVYTADDLLSEGTPSRIYTEDDGTETSVYFGIDVALGDVDGDGLDDLLVGARNHDGDAGTSAGAAWLFLAADDDGRQAWSPVFADEASWSVEGDNSYDYLGWGVALGDDDGDGFAEVWVGSPSDELPDGDSSTGAVLRYDGAAVAGTSFGTRWAPLDADQAWSPLTTGGFFGLRGLAVVGDIDGDGLGDAVATAPRDDHHGDNASSVYQLLAAPDVARLEVPADASSSLLGQRGSLAFVDITGDRDADLVGGAWSQPDEVLGYNAGQVFAWADEGGATSTTREGPWAGHVLHSANDRYGYAVAGGDVDGDGRDDLVVAAWNDSQPTDFDPSDVLNPYDCPEQKNGAGSIWVHLGTSSGIEAEPAFVAYAYDAYAHIDQVAVADLDGDGHSEVVFGSVSAASEGGIGIVRGRPAVGGGTTVICDVEHVLGVSSSSRLGNAVAAAGDLDGDGCDEVAVGADADDLGFSNQGSVRILWGDGSGCSGPAVTTLGPEVSNTRFGDALAGGLDADDDGVPDVVAGGYDHEVGGVDHGAAWLLSGAWLASLPRQSAPGWSLPSDGGTDVQPLTDAPVLEGTTPHAEYGRGVALVPDPERPGAALVAVGSRYGAVAGAPLGGGVDLWRADGSGFDEVPAAVVSGEQLPEGWFGEGLAGHPDQPVLAVGGAYGHVDGIDRGVVYPFWLP